MNNLFSYFKANKCEVPLLVVNFTIFYPYLEQADLHETNLQYV